VIWYGELIMLKQLAMWDVVYSLQRFLLGKCSQQNMEVCINDRHKAPQNVFLHSASFDFQIIIIM
jgi:hypothetical protein